MKENNQNDFRKHKGPGKPRMKICPNIVNGNKCEQLSYNRTSYCSKCNYYFFQNKSVIYRKKSNFDNKKNKKKKNKKKKNKNNKNIINISVQSKINFDVKVEIPGIIKLNSKIKYEFPYKPHETRGFITPEYRDKKKLVF